MNNVLMRKIDGTGAYAALADTQTVITVTISCPPANASNVLFQGDDGSEVAWIPGEYHTLERVDLAAIQAKIAIGDTLTLVGGTW